jgi:two-component system, NtrC family, response regulator HydG
MTNSGLSSLLSIERRSRSERHGGHTIVGSSPAMRRVHEFIQRVAPSDASILILGESGTGKELVVRAIHDESPRARGPLVAVNCAAIPEQLLESELFGHVRGSFSGAVVDKKGKMELANGGTLFLDEVAELPMLLQSKLLRALQEREIEPVGGSRPVQVDVRVIAATNVNLREAVEQKTLRQDLYFRLDVISLLVPPLRERREDVIPLAEYFLERFSAAGSTQVLSEETCEVLLRHDWPGNVRELQNAIQRATVMGAASGVLQPGDLPEAVRNGSKEKQSSGHGYRASVRAFKRQMILDAIEASGGSMTEAAHALMVNPCYLHRLMRTLGLREGKETAPRAELYQSASQ